MAEDEIVGWHHQHNGHEFEQTLGERRTEEPGVLQSMGSQRVGHNLVTERQQMRKEKDGGTEPASDEVTVMGVLSLRVISTAGGVVQGVRRTPP